MPKLPHSERADLDRAALILFELQTEVESNWGILRSETDVTVPNPVTLSKLQRRTLARSIAAFVEGMTFTLKYFSVSSEAAARLSASELALAREEAYELSDRGQPIIRKAKLRTSASLRFAFELMAKTHGCQYSLDASGPGWAALQAMLTIRDRVMHPRALEDLSISDDEINRCCSAYNWILAQLILVFATTIATLRGEAAVLKDRSFAAGVPIESLGRPKR